MINSVSAFSNKDDYWLFNDHVNSAVELLQLNYEYPSSDLRDILIFLLQGQEPPEQYALFRTGYGDQDLALALSEVDSVFAVFKLAEIIVNGKWAWKRKATGLLEGTLQGTLVRRNGREVEDFLEVIDYAINWLKRANIDPGRYVENSQYPDRLRQSFARKRCEPAAGRHPFPC